MKTKNKLNDSKTLRHFRIRKKISGASDKPRLSVKPSGKHFEAQLVNDFEAKTLYGASTKSGEFKKSSGLKTFGDVKAAMEFGKYFAQTASKQGYKQVVFDRGGYLYHGRIKAFADAARESGLQF